MKKIITLALVVCWVLTSYSQEIIELDETTLNFSPTGEIVFEDYQNGVLKVKETYQHQFQSNAIAFVNENFDIGRYREESGNLDGNIFITLRSPKGQLTAQFDHKNQLVNTNQKFKDVPLPFDVRNEVYAQFKGWTISKNRYFASGREANIDKEKYIVYLEKDKSREKIKITPSRSSVTGVATIEKF
ncbi:hypothetical protein [Christiangramia sabulilitoris]|uniref:Uncharacterized protein n=1 Tax=Christiangramia sabulilitoris TaxID=2583991 RepID=A0A550I6D8_9FLAO|nr:hypothetical protein [Christiangramia sabulilitoris]TRO66533.1 hypothetical protein FGM01_01230 [Christiangramia sabulilitoris]